MNTLEIMPTIGEDLDYVPEGLAEAQQGFLSNAIGESTDSSCTVQKMMPDINEVRNA